MNITLSNRVGLSMFCVAKVSGMAGLALGCSTHRTMGACLLVAAGVLLVITVALAITTMIYQNKQPWKEDEGIS